MKALVTGSSGHLGEALVRTMLGQNHEVTGIDLTPAPFTSHPGSLLDRSLLEKCLEGADTVFHTATLHKPHVATHHAAQFIETNISGTQLLLEASVAAGVRRFIFTSTTSVFGDALTPPPEAPAAWITEEVVPIPKNIYGVTKAAAENLCQLFYRNHGLPVMVLRTSRFFPEQDDDPKRREEYAPDNLKANEYLFRRVDIGDVVQAHLLAAEKAVDTGFGTYVISATSPFQPDDLAALRTSAASVVQKYVPGYVGAYRKKNWKMMPSIDRVYVNTRAREELGWKPVYDFSYVVGLLEEGKGILSPLAQLIGSRGYHPVDFPRGPYPL